MIKILYEDKFIIVCEKPVGILSEVMSGIKNMPQLLEKQTRTYKIDTIHRLDRNVGGVMVYSKTSKATIPLAKMMASHKFTKEYLAVVHGIMPATKGKMEDFLVKNKKIGKVFTTKKQTSDSKYALLKYEVLAQKDNKSLVKVKLHTGRTHQIRIQFSSRGFPLCNDTKYGATEQSGGKTPIALWSYHLGFNHPITKKEMEFYSYPPKTFPFYKEIFNIFGL